MGERPSLAYLVLDVFSTKSYKGNPLSVVFTNGDLKIDEYQNISREFGYSETSFVYYSEENKALKVRSFTPTGFEVDGAGHNLLGAVCAAVLKKIDIFSQQAGETYVIMKDGPIHLRVDLDNKLPVVKMLQRPAVFGESVYPEIIVGALGIELTDLSIQHFAPTVVQTEVAHLMVELKDITVLNRIKPENKSLIEISKKYDFEGFYCFAIAEADCSIAQARFFNPLIGIDEDAATGTAAGPLAGILCDKQIIQQNKVYQILQGVKLNQPSLIEVMVKTEGIWVGGSAVITMEGKIFLS